MRNKTLTNIARIGFLGWIIFELLNFVGILHFSLDFTWIGLVITAGFVWGAIEITSHILHKKTGYPLPWFVLFGSLLSISLDALGDVMHLYTRFEWYDQLCHGTGGAMAALIAFFIFWQLTESGRIVIGKKLVSFFAITTSISLGVLYELEEYLEDVFTSSSRSGGGTDTVNDMLLNTIGAVGIVLIIFFFIKKKKQT